MKKWIVTLLTVLCILSTGTPAIAAEEVEIYLDGNGGTFTYYLNGEESNDFFDDIIEVGTTIRENKGSNAILSDPVSEDSSKTFLGWAANIISDNGDDTFDYIPLSDTPLTSAEVLDYPMPEGTVLFYALWDEEDAGEEDASEEDAGEEDAEEVEFYLDGNGGTFTYYMDGEVSNDFFGDFTEVGTTIREMKGSNAILSDPVFWDSSRTFLGWIPNNISDNGDDTFDYIPLSDTPLTSAEVLDYPMPKDTVIFLALWDGEDADYYSVVNIQGFGVEIPFLDMVGTPDGMTQEETSYEIRWDLLKESDESIGAQLSNNYVFNGEPTKENAEFEGWIEISFEILEDLTEHYEMISDTPITTEELLERKVPSYDVIFVAKWSDVDISEYYEHYFIESETEGDVTEDTTTELPIETPELITEVDEHTTEIKETTTEAKETTTEAKETTIESTEEQIDNTSTATGDSSNIIFMLVTLLVSGAALTVLIIKKNQYNL